ncbi:chromosome segregation ATPase [Comamonas sp. BIGb0152]|uniref:hypothetical protein n=1 Tax=Comamonas sp. BIGb0152 TaxID=2940601 RepID=UPI00216A2FB5|nr:hypothetical protein [Comamonas sp. BIGb0152]MCS4292868.1 chromosome segregation ATPase [Comamonas sp. BIGb0152]
MPRLNTLTLVLLLVTSSLAQAATGQASNAQERTQARAQIALERKDSEARLANNEKICYQHFAVTDCLQKVRRQYNTEERALRQRELAINAKERDEKTANQRDARANKQNDFERKHPPLDGGALSQPDLEQRQKEHNEQAAQRSSQGPKRNAESIAEQQQRREQDAARRASSQAGKVDSKQRTQQRHNQERADSISEAQEEYDAKQEAAQRKLEAHDKRMKEQEGKRKAAPLPVPQ